MAVPVVTTSASQSMPLALRRAAPRYMLTVQELEASPPPASARATILLALVLVGGFIAWALHFPVAERARAGGEIIPAGQVQPVQVPEGGRVAELLVRAGDRVQAGSVLARLDPETARTDAAAARARETALTLTAARLAAAAAGSLADLGPVPDGSLATIHDSQAATAEGTARLRAAQLAVLDAEIASRQAAATTLAEQVAPAVAIRDLTRTEHAVTAAQFGLGLARRNEVFALNQARLRTEGEAARIASDLETARLAVAEVRARRLELAARARSEALAELARVEADLAETRQARLRAEARLARLAIEAPVSGVVKQMTPRGTGSVLEPGGLLAEIVPDAGRLLADVELPADRIGGVRIGHAVRVHVLTYDAARFGTLDGTVQEISAASFRRQDGSAIFRLRVALASEYLGDPAQGRVIAPGMTVRADIITGRQPLLSWLAKPVRNAMDGAFAER